MFVSAIEEVKEFTRPIHSIRRYYGSDEPIPGAASLFFINPDGWALTCKHVADFVAAGDRIEGQRSAYLADYASMRGKQKEKQIIRLLEKKYQLTQNSIIQLRNMFINCVEGPLDVEAVLHPSIDLALLHFRNYTALHPKRYAVFPRDTSGLKQGKYLCRVGFPFAEFTNFRFNAASDTIEWSATGRDSTPLFPIEGMLTRFLNDSSGIIGFEMSTPGLRGQSGGPVFDTDACIWGVQAATSHLDLDFDVNRDVIRNGQRKSVKESAFLHVGHCIHIDVIKSFMHAHNVAFTER